jgi:hypothetical protein
MTESLTPIADAIRRGSEGREQCFETYINTLGNACCALGAAAYGAGYGTHGSKMISFFLPDAFPILYDHYYSLTGLGETIARWNDEDKLSFAEIADRVAAIERGEVAL